MEVASHVTKIIHIKFKIFMRRVKSLVKKTTPSKFEMHDFLIYRSIFKFQNYFRTDLITWAAIVITLFSLAFKVTLFPFWFFMVEG